jgi:sensor histidine kinase YesM
VIRWIAYAVAWLLAAVFWSLASASGARVPPIETFPYGLLAMSAGAVMGVGIWRMTERVPFDWRAPAFYLAHLVALPLFAVTYGTSWMWPDMISGRFPAASLLSSPYLMWNLLMGSWLYLLVAGLSYAIRAQRRLNEARVLAERAQLAALRAQINPHFLFNALHSVGALVSSDPARADKAIESLGDLLRYALGTGDEVLFAQEWRFTQDYLAFEQLRLGDRLRLDVDADADAMSLMVPPLILQPLVENAVRHGIADRPEGGRIEVRASVQDSRLTLRVADDGHGAGYDGNGVGLSSVRQRLAAVYGDRARLHIDKTAGGFVVTIGLPA